MQTGDRGYNLALVAGVGGRKAGGQRSGLQGSPHFQAPGWPLSRHVAGCYAHLHRAGVCLQLCLLWDFEAQEEGEKAGSLRFWLSSKDTRWLQLQRVMLTRVGAIGESERGRCGLPFLVTMNTLGSKDVIAFKPLHCVQRPCPTSSGWGGVVMCAQPELIPAVQCSQNWEDCPAGHHLRAKRPATSQSCSCQWRAGCKLPSCPVGKVELARQAPPRWE